jgi:hypothetical protein
MLALDRWYVTDLQAKRDLTPVSGAKTCSSVKTARRPAALIVGVVDTLGRAFGTPRGTK